VYGAARSGVKIESVVDDSQLLAMDVTSEESVAAAVSFILRKHKVASECHNVATGNPLPICTH